MRVYATCGLSLAPLFGFAVIVACGGPAKESLHPEPEAVATGTGSVPSADPSAPTTTSDLGPASTGTKLGVIAPSASASTESPKSAGEPGRSKEDIRIFIETHRPEARACYDAAQAVTATLEGDITVLWTIDSKGAVTEVSIDAGKTTLNDTGLSTCITSLFKKQSFAKSAKGLETHAIHTFNFHPKAFSKKP
jgi:hypothetical protein